MERHRTDVLSLVFGLLFTAAGTAVLVGGWWRWMPWVPELWPLLLILVGLWVLVATFRRDRQPGSPDAQPPASPDEEGRDGAAPAGEEPAEFTAPADDPPGTEKR